MLKVSSVALCYALMMLVIVGNAASATYEPVRIEYKDLLVGVGVGVGTGTDVDVDGGDTTDSTTEKCTQEAFLDALQNVGMISITNILPLSAIGAGNTLLQNMAPCIRTTGQEASFPDGTIRHTIAIDTHHGYSSSTTECIDFQASNDIFRKTVDTIVESFTKYLSSILDLNDQPLLVSKNANAAPYTLNTIVKEGEHLEHFHVYNKNNSNGSGTPVPPDNTKTLDWHTDQGLMLAFTPGIDTTTGLPTDGFFIQLSDGSTEEVHFTPQDDLVLFFGDGVHQMVNDALYSKNSAPLRALPHALHLSSSTTTQERFWYGRMMLAPENALHPTLREPTTFGELRTSMIQSNDDVDIMTLGCSNPLSMARLLQNSANACDVSVESYCWHSCMAYDQYDVSPSLCESQELGGVICADAKGVLWNDTHHDPMVQIRCEKSATMAGGNHSSTGGGGGDKHEHEHEHNDGGDGTHAGGNGTHTGGGDEGEHEHNGGGNGTHTGGGEHGGGGGHGGNGTHTEGEGGHGGNETHMGGEHGDHGGHGGNHTNIGGDHGGHDGHGENGNDMGGGHGGHGGNGTHTGGGEGEHGGNGTDTGHNSTGGMDDCFSGNSLVKVENSERRVKMADLAIGDLVKVGPKTYEPVYSFGHKNNDASTRFIQIATTSSRDPLEISAAHMVMVEGEHAVPASIIKIGDKLITSSGETTTVESIRYVVRKGLYAPFTTSGTIVVNDIMASNYISYQGSEYLSVAGIETPVSFQWLAHSFNALHRLAYKFGIVTEDTYTETGISDWVNVPHAISAWIFEQHDVVVVSLLLPAVLLLGLVSTMEALLLSPATALAVATLIAFVVHQTKPLKIVSKKYI